MSLIMSNSDADVSHITSFSKAPGFISRSMRLERLSPLRRVESEVEEDGAAVRISGQRGDESAVGAGSKMVKDGVADDDEVWRRLVADRRGEPAW
ncbi:uncharacterized protein A4U43_C09F10770 [Asparagus officinalis]|uniref:Uncharacterized protein n=1 Tax=Asparagus officinalis TaxID=4686 RepID=A0A5P1E6N6_ASPOF|nr:uncharacterized protein A4U43_C09F10770 [Asparagus officinalis]